MSIQRSFERENGPFDDVHYVVLRLTTRGAAGVDERKQLERDYIEGELDVWERISVKEHQQSVT